MADNKCTGECIKCSFQQQVYCSSQRSYAIMENQRVIVERLDRIDAALDALTAKEDIINPIEKKAQKAAGAENRAEETS